ncbi:restriction endonuclease subunit S [Geoalkalibacter subterraneus]|uniref:Type I restriction modification DNA specificity domain-containing protein n=1 Tax=Geoalkalibacter subterraneus TaxID=483547 RepID=A0A0B5FH27_9BACT|nr:restriction endonuclease subunit S [Geoalkalibacter subterraneus]AJF06673.1 hypothetical protein GSUB_09145 [Geoalkalibacter subterraneus]
MTAETFFANFGHLADAPNGVQKLRELILQLAVQGKLVAQDPKDEAASALLEKIDAERKLLVKAGKVRKPKKYEPVEEKEQFCLVPENWCWSRMGELILDITGGGTPSKNNPSYWGGDIPWASVKDVGKSKYLDSTIDSITPKGLKGSSSNLIPKGRVIICTRMGLGKISINRVDVAINQDLKALWLPACLEMDYFYNFFLTQDVKGTGMTVSGIRQDALLNMPVPLPPLEEQKRIVAKVDQLMALCDELEARQQKQQQGRARLNNAALDALLTAREPDEFAEHWQRISTNFDLLYDHPETIAKLRAAILQLAVQGKLVPQDPNDEPASVLLERIKADRQSMIAEGMLKRFKLSPVVEKSDHPFIAPKGWVFERMGNLFQFIDYRGKTPKKVSSGIKLITAKNVRMGHLRQDPQEFVTEKTYREWMRRGFPQVGDLLFTTEAPMGNVCLVEIDEPFALAQRTINLHPFGDQNPRYLMFAIMSGVVQGLISELATGMTATGIKAAKLKLVPLPLPPFEEQMRIVTKVDNLMALCDELEAQLNQAQQHSEKLMEATVRQLLVA